jgi:hypothetical protein
VKQHGYQNDSLALTLRDCLEDCTEPEKARQATLIIHSEGKAGIVFRTGALSFRGSGSDEERDVIAVELVLATPIVLYLFLFIIGGRHRHRVTPDNQGRKDKYSVQGTLLT